MNYSWLLGCLVVVGCGGDNLRPDAGPVTLTLVSYRGIATSNPPGIHCGRCFGPPPYGPLACPDTTQYAECSAEFAFGTTVQLALTDSAYQVVSCNGEIASGYVCSVTMDGSKTFAITGGEALQ